MPFGLLGLPLIPRNKNWATMDITIRLLNKSQQKVAISSTQKIIKKTKKLAMKKRSKK
jgi:hypothetical protein